jgi:GTPase SAR1 family protein
VLTQPTVGSNVESLRYENLRFEAWDLGGQMGMRSMWGTYYRNTDAVILMVRPATNRG